jgi:hypothetical protein
MQSQMSRTNNQSGERVNQRFLRTTIEKLEVMEMAANSTQADATGLLFIALLVTAAGLAEDVIFVALIAGGSCLASSIILFQKCKPWEDRDEN